MTIDEGIKYAEEKLYECIRNNEEDYILHYWRGYIDGLKAAKRSLDG